MDRRFEIPCRPYDRRRFLRQREIHHREKGDGDTDRVRRRRREGDRPEEEAGVAGRGSDRRDGDECPRLAEILRRADRGCEKERRAALAAPQSHHDEDIRPGNVRARRIRLLQGRFREARSGVERVGRERQQRTGRSDRENKEIAGSQKSGDRGGHPGGVQEPASPRDGRLGQGNHEPARAERYHRRRIDAGRHSRLGEDVGARRKAARHEGDDPRPVLRDDVPDDRRGLQAARGVRSRDHRIRPERRPHGAKGGGVRIPRQDVPRPGKRDDPGRGSFRYDPAGAEGGGRGYLPDVPDEGRPDPGLGQACRQESEGNGSGCRILAGQEQGARRAAHRKGR